MIRTDVNIPVWLKVWLRTEIEPDQGLLSLDIVDLPKHRYRCSAVFLQQYSQ
jgi:hypothetical protein